MNNDCKVLIITTAIIFVGTVLAIAFAEPHYVEVYDGWK